MGKYWEDNGRWWLAAGGHVGVGDAGSLICVAAPSAPAPNFSDNIWPRHHLCSAAPSALALILFFWLLFFQPHLRRRLQIHLARHREAEFKHSFLRFLSGERVQQREAKDKITYHLGGREEGCRSKAKAKEYAAINVRTHLYALGCAMILYVPDMNVHSHPPSQGRLRNSQGSPFAQLSPATAQRGSQPTNLCENLHFWITILRYLVIVLKS
jgi:hypothetical protein